MDTNQKQAQQQPQQGVVATTDQPVQQPAVSNQPVSVGVGHKEHGTVVQAEVSNLLTLSEAEPVLEPELKAAGVEVVPHERPQLPQDVKQMGVELAKDSVPVSTQPSGIVQLPMTKQQAMQTLQQNKKNPKLSIDWLALFVLKLLKKQEKTQGARQ